MSDAPHHRFRFEHAWLIDGTNGPVVDNGCLVVDGKHIVYAGPLEAAPPLAEAETVIDAAGKTIIPGLFNCHVHLFAAEPQPLVLNTLKASMHLRAMLEAGITTIRVLGGDKTTFGEIHIRNAVRQGIVPGPRMTVAGTRITMTGGFGARNARTVDGPHEMRKVVREIAEAGADWIKLVATKNTPSPGREMAAPELTIEEMRAAVEEADKAGLQTAAHAMGVTGIKNALRAGVHCIEHGNLLDDEAIEMMLAQGAWLDPTFSVHITQIEHAADLKLAPQYVDRLKAGNAGLFRSYGNALAAGIPIATGTDAGTPANPHGHIVVELQSVTQAGASVPRAIHNATLASARLTRFDDQVGSLEAGKLADVVIADGDLQASWAPLTRPWLVLQAGTPVSGPAAPRLAG